MAFGQGQFELGLIIWAASENLEAGELKQMLWPRICEAGDRMDAHARISSQEAIIIVPSTASLPRSDKGSIMRKEVYTLFEKEITEVYERLSEKVPEGLLPLDATNMEAGIRSVIEDRMPNWRIPKDAWDTQQDLFELGMDSMQAMQLRRILMACWPYPDRKPLPKDFVYRNPSVANMTNAIKAYSNRDVNVRDLPDRAKQINEMVSRFSTEKPSGRKAGNLGAVILLTGSTGSLGCHLLAHLADLPMVSRIICIIRPQGIASKDENAVLPKQRQEQALLSKLLTPPQTWETKIEVIATRTNEKNLGLHATQYLELQQTVTHVLHNGWPMDFDRHLLSFTSQFQTLNNLLELTRGASLSGVSKSKVKLSFCSSIAVVGQYCKVHKVNRVPEEVMGDDASTNRIGYAEAKLLCEKMLEKAQYEFPDLTEVCFVRIGQMSGSSRTGYWNTSEHFPALVKTSQIVGAVPDLKGVSSEPWR